MTHSLPVGHQTLTPTKAGFARKSVCHKWKKTLASFRALVIPELCIRSSAPLWDPPAMRRHNLFFGISVLIFQERDWCRYGQVATAGPVN